MSPAATTTPASSTAATSSSRASRFRLKKSTDDSIRPLSLNVVVQEAAAGRHRGAAGLARRRATGTRSSCRTSRSTATRPRRITIQTKTGYTGDPPQSRADILKHSQFQDVRVHVFAKHSASQWVEIATFDIPRQVLAQ